MKPCEADAMITLAFASFSSTVRARSVVAVLEEVGAQHVL